MEIMDTQAHPHAPVLPAAKLNVVTARHPVTGKVVSNASCLRGKSASFVKHTEIDVGGTPLEGAILAGQSFGVIPPGVDERGAPHKVRLYSLACPSYGEDGAGKIISTTPKRVVEEVPDGRGGVRLFLGVCSNYLCDLKPGDEVQLTGPSGKRFLLPIHRDGHDYLFVATGTGIAPFRGMVKELLEHPQGGVARRVDLIAGAPYTTDLLYDDFFTGLAERHENFGYHPAVSREMRSDNRQGVRVHELLEERMDEFAPRLARPSTLLYICGIAGMQAGLYEVLARHGLAHQFFMLRGERRALASRGPERLASRLRPTPRCMIEVY